MSADKDDIKVLEGALRVISLALDALVAASTDAEGKPRAPDRGALMKAKAMLPPYCSQALKKDRP